jgi:uncharacterized protein (TIGR02145 family)
MKNTRVTITYPILIFGLVLLVACNRSTNDTNHLEIETGSFTDPRDGKIYETVKIGDQWIMAENLAYMPEIGNFWTYDNNDSNIAIYGYLYDWETAMNIAPKGWHLPSRVEWNNVQKALGAKRYTWYYLKMMYPKLVVGGSSGLNMLLGGMRTCEGEYKYLNERARFWTSTTSRSGNEQAVYGLDHINNDDFLSRINAPYVFNNAQFRGSCSGFSVRLFKD